MTRMDRAFITAALVVTSIVSGYQLRSWQQDGRQEECIAGYLVVPSQLGLVVVGDQELCGYQLRWTDISGPPKPRPTRLEGGSGGTV